MNYNLRRRKEPTTSMTPKRAAPDKKGKGRTKKQKQVEEITETKGEDVQPKHEGEMLEKGFVYFFYRPKIGHEEVSSIEDVQRLYMLLCPHSTATSSKGMTLDQEHTKRLLLLPKKQLPEAKKHSKLWGVVYKVSKKIEEIDEQLASEVYQTQTRGERHLEGARPVGEGIYGIVQVGNHTHFSYVLEMPQEISEVQEAFHIHHEATCVISVKNPTQPSRFGAAYKGGKKAEYSEELMKRFQGITGELRFAPCNPPTFLDYEGTEVILIGASEDLRKELGKAGEELETLEKKDEKKVSSEKLYQELHLSKKEHPPQPLLRGQWK